MKQIYRALLLALLTVLGVQAQTNYTLTSDDVVVTDGVIESCSYDFSQNADGTILTIPDTLDDQTISGIADGQRTESDGTVYREGVFSGKKIISVTLPSTIEFIGAMTFYNNLIETLDLSNCTALASIRYWTFAVNSISSLDLSSCTALTSIGERSFFASSISSLDLSSCIALASIGDRAFYNNSIETLNLSNCTALATIGDHAFFNNDISSLDLSSCTALASIRDHAFHNNDISSLDLSSCTALASIGEYAFYNNSISSFDLPIPTIDGFTFINWINSYGSSKKKVTNLLSNYDAQFEVYTLTENDLVIENGIIVECKRARFNSEIIIPETLGNQTIIGIADLKSYGEGLFAKKGITSVSLPSTIEFIGDKAFYKNLIETLDLSSCTALTSIGDYAFYTNSIETLVLRNCTALASIGDYAFYTNAIKTLDLSSCTALTSIGEYSFCGNMSIASLNLSNCTALTNIGENAFEYNSLSHLDLSSCTALISIGQNTFANNDIVNLNINNCTTLVSIGGSAFWNNSIKTLNLSNCTALVSIGSGAFYNNSISSVDLSNCTALTSIEENAFYNNSISNVDLSSCTALTSIGEKAFYLNDISSFALPTPVVIGYSFSTWKSTEYDSFRGGARVSDCKVGYKAYFTVKGCEIVFDANQGEGTMANQTITFADSANLTVNTFTRTAYTFASWNTAADGSGNSYADGAEFKMDVEGDTLYAQWIMINALESLTSSSISVYPNPATNFVTISNPKGYQNIQIYNLSGQLVKQVKSTSTKEQINISDLTSGMYYVSINGITEKLIIK